MLNAVRKMSLRTRLALLAGFAIFALVVASFVAWRLARATETFALRQADSSVHAAARDLARELQRNPDGYLSIEQALPDPPDRPQDRGPRGNDSRPRKIPPHVETSFTSYSDPLARLTAVTLHRYPNVAGGFYRPEAGGLIGYAFPEEEGSGRNIPADLTDTIREVASNTVTTEAPSSRVIQIGNDRVILVGYPADSMTTAWAMQRVSHLSGVSDLPNLGALIALGLSIITVSGLALLTVRDLRQGVTGIETGLAALTNDLTRQITTPNTAELARIAAAINELAAKLQANIERRAQLERELRQSERLSSLGRVVAGVAHEVRNPLSAIKLKAQLIRRSSYSADKLNETIDVVCAEIERLDSLVRRLLELGGQQRLELTAVDLGKLVSARVALFSDLATRAAVTIVNLPCPNIIQIEADAHRLSQVMDNLIQNALDAMPDGGQLTIGCTCSRDANGSRFALLTFEDTGHGINAADQEHIFEPFHTNRAAGTGLGLAIARAIVEEHGGRLDFISGARRGAAFAIKLPLPGEAVNEVKA